MAVVIESMPSRPFENQVTEPKCCCGRIQVVRGIFIIGVLEMVSMLVTAIAASVDQNPGGSSGAVIGTIVLVVCVLLMWFGALKRQPSWMIPHLVLQIVGIVLAAAAIVSMIALFALNSLYLDEFLLKSNYIEETTAGSIEEEVSFPPLITGLFAFALTTLVVLIVIELWFVVIILRAYKYVVAKKNFRKVTYYAMASMMGPLSLVLRDSPALQPPPYREREHDTSYY